MEIILYNNKLNSPLSSDKQEDKDIRGNFIENRAILSFKAKIYLIFFSKLALHFLILCSLWDIQPFIENEKISNSYLLSIFERSRYIINQLCFSLSTIPINKIIGVFSFSPKIKHLWHLSDSRNSAEFS